MQKIQFILIYFIIYGCTNDVQPIYKNNNSSQIQGKDMDTMIIKNVKINDTLKGVLVKTKPALCTEIWSIYTYNMNTKIYKLNISDTLTCALITYDSIFDCNNDGFSDLVIAECSTTGSFGGCGYTIYEYFPPIESYKKGRALSMESHIIFMKDKDMVLSWEENYDFQVIKYYKWVSFDSLTLVKKDSMPILPNNVNALSYKIFTSYYINGNLEKIEKRHSASLIVSILPNCFGCR